MRVVNFAQEYLKEKTSGDEVWVVFDKDDFPNDDFDNACKKAEANSFYVAWSNPCFELWYLLHFGYRDTGINRVDFEQLLTKLLGFKYEKNYIGMSEILKDKTETAIRNAETLLTKYSESIPKNRMNPATTVHELVKKLIR